MCPGISTFNLCVFFKRRKIVAGAGPAPGHFYRTAEVPLSKKLNLQLLRAPVEGSTLTLMPRLLSDVNVTCRNLAYKNKYFLSVGIMKDSPSPLMLEQSQQLEMISAVFLF